MASGGGQTEQKLKRHAPKNAVQPIAFQPLRFLTFTMSRREANREKFVMKMDTANREIKDLKARGGLQGRVHSTLNSNPDRNSSSRSQ